MSNNKQSIDRQTLFTTHPLQLSSEWLNLKKSHGTRNSSVSNRNTIDLSSLGKSSNTLYDQVNSKLNHKPTSLNQRRSLQTTRLIPLKLGTATTISQNVPINGQNSTPTSSAIYRIPRVVTTPDIHGLPCLNKELRSTMAGVKLLYLRENYKRCAMRCRMLLESVHDSSHTCPAYRVYLASYLTSSLEVIAFTLPNHSPSKLSLYKEALTCLNSATSELDYALFCTDSIVRNSSMSDASSQLSSDRSSVDSVFSHYSKASSIASYSPLPEEYTHSDSIKDSESSDCRRKKVSFSLPPYDEQDFSLNFDEAIQSVSTSSLLDSFPIPLLNSSINRRTSLEPAPLNLSSTRSLSPLFNTRSPNSSRLPYLRRYQTLLSGFQLEFDNRINDIKRAIDKISRDSVDIRTSCELEPDVKKLRRRRIDTGFPRKRFDGSRYQALCEKALIEL